MPDPYISVKLPNGVITLSLARLQATNQTTAVSGSTRITEQNNTRVTRGGNTRVTRSYTITSRPELGVLKLDNGVIKVSVPSDASYYAKQRAKR